ncbi:MAG: MFS transporter [Caldiserica bacterium]|nr:MFS transporter [Caldisericota bacterium]MDH7561935.1 MFS transporter [Caldisericota bacterium]
MGKPSIFTVVRRRNPFLLWIGQLVSTLGDNFEYIALMALAYHLSGSTLVMGGVMVAYMVPNLIFSIFSSVMVDRWDRRMTMFLSDILRGVIILIPPILLLVGKIQVWHLYLYSVLFGSVTPFFNNANSALLPNLVRKEEYMAMNSLMQTSIQLAGILGLALGGAAVAFLGYANAYFFDSLTFFFSAVTIFLLKIARTERARPPEKFQISQFLKSWFRDFKEGVLFFKVERSLLWLLLIASMVNFAFGPISILLLPFVEGFLGQTVKEFGWIMSSVSLGTFLGAIFMGSLGIIRNRRSWILFAVGALAVMTMCLPVSRFYPLAMLLLFGIGFSLPMANIPIATVFQEKVPDNLRGRVFGVRGFLAQSLTPVSTALGGMVADLIGVRLTIFFCGVLALLVLIPSIFIPHLYGLNLQAKVEGRTE